MMSNRITVIVASLLAVIAFAAGVVAMTASDEPVACTADARLDAPEGWMWIRDGGNDCAWTLYDTDGNEAPDSVYEAAGESPPPSSGDPTALIAFGVGAIAALIAIITVVRARGERDEGSGVD